MLAIWMLILYENIPLIQQKHAELFIENTDLFILA